MGDHFSIQDTKKSKMIGKGNIMSGLYILWANNTKHRFKSYRSCNTLSSCNVVSTSNNAQLWHLRLGHLSDSMHGSASNKIQIIVPSDFDSQKCIIYPLAKLKRLSFKYENHFSPKNFDLIHYDLLGLYGKPTYNGKSYFLTIVDDFIRFIWIYLLTNKSEALIKIQQFFTLVKTQYGKVIKDMRSDNARGSYK